MQAATEKEFDNRQTRLERNLGLETAYDAIKDNDSQAFLALLRAPYFDINQCATLDIRRQDGITLLADFTPMTYAISFAKPEWVELFLLMGANPFGGHYYTNPINLVDHQHKTPSSIKIAQLLWQYQGHDEPGLDSISCVSDHKIIFSGSFINAITTGDDKTAAKLLSDGVIIYTDQCCHNISISNIASTLAVRSKSLSTVALLVQRGAIITEPATRQFLHDNKHEAWCQPIAALFALEKSKQIAIMELFCVAQGNLELCRDAILRIRQQYQEKVDALKNGQTFNMEWQGFGAMKNQIMDTLNPTRSILSTVDDTRSSAPIVNPSQNISTLFSHSASRIPIQPHHNQNPLKAGAFLLAAGTIVTTISLGVLLKSPTFAIFVLPQVSMFFMSIAATIGLLMLAAGIYMTMKACCHRRAENLQQPPEETSHSNTQNGWASACY